MHLTHKASQKNKLIFALLTLLVLFALSAFLAFNISSKTMAADSANSSDTSVTAADTANSSEITFTVTGPNGTVNDYVQNGIHYLLLPRDISLSNLQIGSSKIIKSASKGQISSDALSLSGDFANKEEITLTVTDVPATDDSDSNNESTSDNSDVPATDDSDSNNESTSDNSDVPATDDSDSNNESTSDNSDVPASDNESTSDDSAADDGSTSDVTLVLLQSKLPSLCISLNGVTQEQINSGSKETKYSGNDVYITNADGSLNVATSDSNKIEIKGRGNSSWYYPKRSYQIKFTKKTEVLGMNGAKKWILLAEDDDATLLRNQTAFSIAEKMNMPGTPACQKIDLWIDGIYQGNYSLCQKIATNSSSLNLGSEGLLMEMDNLHYLYEDQVFTSSKKNHFVFQESNCEEGSDEETQQLTSFHEKINTLEATLYADSKDWSTIQSLIDEESWAKYYLLQEFTENHDAMISSVYFYRDGAEDEIKIGPIWDMSLSMGNSARQNIETDYLCDASISKNKAGYFAELMKIKEFRELVLSIYKSDFKIAVNEAQSELNAEAEDLEESVYMNYQIRWPGRLGNKNIINAGQPYEASYQENITLLTNWMSDRLNIMGTLLQKSSSESDSNNSDSAGSDDANSTDSGSNNSDSSSDDDASSSSSSNSNVSNSSSSNSSSTTKYINSVKSYIRKISAGKACFKVTWNKPSKKNKKKISAYQIQYSRYKNFKKASTKTIKSNTKTSATIKKLGKKKVYYVRIRNYRIKGKHRYYSHWSKAKKVKTK